MEFFNFDGATINTRSTGTPSATVTGVITDATPSPVSFTLSVSAKTPSSALPTFLRVNELSGGGFQIRASTFVTPADTVSIVFGLNTTTATRTAFTMTSNPLLQTSFNTLVGSASPDGSTITFTISNPTSTAINVLSLTAGFTCFCAGTRIATPDGPQRVETLKPGDLVQLEDGRDVPVRWLGRQQVDPSVAHPAEANPIRITAGALGAGIPERDLRVSPDHALAIDGHLINAGALVNGTTIYQERDVRDSFTYYHIETDAHELVLAEGVAAETFIDYTTRDAFENADEAADRVIPEMPLPRISTARLVPTHIKRRLQPVLAAE